MVHAPINQIETAYSVNWLFCSRCLATERNRSIEEFDGRLICGQSQLPRLEKVPVRMPYPPAPDQGSIFENQRLVAGKSFQ